MPEKKPKQIRQISPWIAHVRKYAIDHNLSYKDATKVAKSTYTAQPQVYVKKEKVPKSQQTYKCEYCDYSSLDKSNYNRHMKTKHLDVDKQRIEAVKATTTIKKYTRGLTSKNPEKVKEAEQKIASAEKKKTEIKKVLDDLKTKPELTEKKKAGRPPKNPSDAKQSTPKPPKAPKQPKPPKFDKNDIVKMINKSYYWANDADLNLTVKNINSFKQTANTIEIELKPGFIVDEVEEIHLIKLVYDISDDHFNATFYQKPTDARVTELLEYDELYVS